MKKLLSRFLLFIFAGSDRTEAPAGSQFLYLNFLVFFVVTGALIILSSGVQPTSPDLSPTLGTPLPPVAGEAISSTVHLPVVLWNYPLPTPTNTLTPTIT